MSEERRGVVMGVAAYVAWGLLPLYWPLLRAAGDAEILAHRVFWSFVFVALLSLRGGERLAELRAIGRRRVLSLAAASLFIGLNWGLYIWSVNHGHVVEMALGYFMNPLVTVMLGVLVLKERLRRAQKIALMLALVAVVVLTFDYGRPPLVAFALALSFGVYSLLKKRVGVSASLGLAVETAVLTPVALVYLLALEARGAGTFGHGSVATSALLASSGVATAIPLLAFAGAANRIPLRTLGPLQYIAPSLQFLCGVVAFGEVMPASRWGGFVLVWIALAIFVVDGVRAQRAPSSSMP